uniref:RNA-directed DNA polymerase n=1 Tax=Tanacetum cinerariifolium TaxID=118510 RepID=A0A6L2IZG8_TANCI|nr:reverse transcriptase domain-containing protein [Tanacetum cinerariifolium]
MATEGPGDLPVPNFRTMEELCHPSLNGRGGLIAPVAIQTVNYGPKNHMIQQSIKVNGVTDDALLLYLFPYSLTHHATAWFDRLPRNSINTFEPPLAILKTFMLQVPTKGANQGQNQPQAYQAPAYQAPVYQAPVHQPQIPKPQIFTTNEFTNFMKANDAILKNIQTNMTSLKNSNLELKNMFGEFMKMNTASSPGSGTLSGNTITNPKEDLKGIITRRGTAYPGPTIPTTSSSPVVEHKTEATKDTMHLTNNGCTEDVQPLVVPTESLTLTSEPVNSPIIEPVASQVSSLRPNQRPSIPYPSRLQDQKLRDKANDQCEKFFQIFNDLNFNISFDDALILMPKFGPSIKSLLTNKDKLFELARTLLNEHCSAVLLKKLPKNLGYPGKFLIPCDFPEMAECLALADLDATINLMSLSIWNKLSMPDLSPTCMTLELVDRSFSHPVGVAKDVFVKVGDLFLRLEELRSTSRYSANYNDMTAKRIDVIDMACEEYSQEVLGFADMIASGNPKAFLNDDTSLPPPNQGNYMPEVHKELKICEAKSDKSSIDEPLEVELKNLPPYLEYAFLEGDDKLPVIIAKDLSIEEKTALITVLKSHKQAITWKLSDIKGIDLLGLAEYTVYQKGGFTVVEKEENELIPTRLVMGWCVCIDCRKLNEATRKDHFPIPFMDQMLERLAGNQYYCFLDGFSGYLQIPIDPKDQEKTTFTCPYGMFAYRRMPFGLCNAPGTCLSRLEKMLKRCDDTNLCLNWEKSYFMVKEGIVLDHKISKEGIKVDKAKVDVITKLPHPTTVKAIQSFLGHVGFYRRKLAEAPILIAPDWDMPFELMCDASEFAIGVVPRQRQEKHFRPIHYASKTMTEAESNYTTTEKEMLAVVYAFDKFRSYLIMNKSIVYTDHSALKYLFAKKDLRRDYSVGFYSSKNSHLKVDALSSTNNEDKDFDPHLYELPFFKEVPRPNFKVNGHRLKHYFREDVPKIVVPDLQTFPKDN